MTFLPKKGQASSNNCPFLDIYVEGPHLAPGLLN